MTHTTNEIPFYYDVIHYNQSVMFGLASFPGRFFVNIMAGEK